MWDIFAGILGWLTNIALGLRFWFSGLLNMLIRFFMTLWGLFVVMVGFVWLAFNDVKVTVAALLSAIGSINAPTGLTLAAPGSFAYWFSVANTFAPMDEMIGYLVIYLHLMVAWGLYKLVKSWLPAVSGSG